MQNAIIEVTDTCLLVVGQLPTASNSLLEAITTGTSLEIVVIWIEQNGVRTLQIADMRLNGVSMSARLLIVDEVLGALSKWVNNYITQQATTTL